MRLYKYGLVVGRFQMFHNGHKYLIERALELCDKVIVYIGSSQEFGTALNPFSYYVREEMLDRVFETETTQKRLLIRPLPDIGVGNNDIWGRYVLGLFEGEFHCQPGLYITGLEKVRSSWFNNEIAPNVDELRITRKGIEISASECRELIRKNDYKNWCELVPTELYDKFEFYHKIMEKI